MSELERRDSRKRRRLSERRRAFSRIGGGPSSGNSGSGHERARLLSAGSSANQSSWSSSPGSSRGSNSQVPPGASGQMDELMLSAALAAESRSESPLGTETGAKISMKIQFHITLAPDNEPLIVDTNQISLLSPEAQRAVQQQQQQPQRSTESIGEHIHQKLSRQNTSSTRRRHQLLAMHNQTALDAAGGTPVPPGAGAVIEAEVHSEDNLALRSGGSEQGSMAANSCPGGREHGARSSTITGGMADEATMSFLARQHQAGQRQRQYRPGSLQVTGTDSRLIELAAPPAPPRDHSSQIQREHIYFKRDGQRFGHEFTLKLAVDKTYRCLLKVRPLIPLQAISVQGHQVLFVDCSQPPNLANLGQHRGSVASTMHRSWQNIHTSQVPSSDRRHHGDTLAGSIPNSPASRHLAATQPRSLGLQHAQTTSNLSATTGNLYQQQQSQMLRHFAASHRTSSSNPHLIGGQLVYMFDWSANRFEVNKNKARTQVQTVLKFKNGQILALPMQVKFYQPERRQHLNWGNQLHFIDYDCNINNMGQISVDRIQYY